MKVFAIACVSVAASLVPAFAQAPSGGPYGSPSARAHGQVGFGAHTLGKPERGSPASHGTPATPQTAASSVTKTAPATAGR